MVAEMNDSKLTFLPPNHEFSSHDYPKPFLRRLKHFISKAGRKSPYEGDFKMS